MTMRYQDLEIEIDRCCCGKQEIRILESTYDRPRKRFVLGDKKRRAIAEKVGDFDRLLMSGDDDASRRRQLAEAIGVELFKILLAGTIGRTFESCHAAALGADEGLRLRLSFGHPYDRELGSLPWELLCNPETRRFLSSEQRTPIVRYLDLGERIEPLTVTAPLRVLIVVAAPDPASSKYYEYEEIDPAPHFDVLERAIGGAKHLQARPLEEATLGALHQKLIGAERAGKPFHAVHFVGHGGFNDDGEGALFFEREDGSEHMVTGAELARQLTKDIRLVVLASCSTGKIPAVRRNGRHPFAGVASAVVAAGKPAVVAMQFSVSEDAVGPFAEAFYGAIDADQTIDNAVTEGRLAIDARGEEGALEWATPVLFLRSADGRILSLTTDELPSKTVAIFNVLDQGKAKLEFVDYQVDLRRYFDGRYVRDPKDWNGAIMEELRQTLRGKVPGESPCHLELAAPLSVGFAAGFLLPVSERRAITVGQREDPWRFDGEEPAGAPSWLEEAAARARIPAEFPLVPGARDVAVVVEGARPTIGGVMAYLNRDDLVPTPPRVGAVVYACFERPDQYAIRGGPHARRLAQALLQQIDAVAGDREYRTFHLFLAGPNGLALAIGRLCHVLPRIQLYEFDKEGKRHGTYEPSIALEPPEMGATP